MEKRFGVGLGGKVKVFASKRGYLWWAFSTREGWKHLMSLPLFALRWLRVRKYYLQYQDEISAALASRREELGKKFDPKP